MSFLTRISLFAAFCGAIACGSAPKPAPESTTVTPAAAPAPPAVAEPVAAQPAVEPTAAPAPEPAPASPHGHGHDHDHAKEAHAAAPGAYTGPDPCTVAVGGKGIIDKACAKGGIKEAKAVMKSMVKKAKKGGMKVDCDTCHTDEKDWSKFSPDVKEKFKALLEASNK